MKRLLFLLLAILLPAPSQMLHADALEDVLIRGWAYTKAGKHVHYEIHVTYTPVKDARSWVSSIEVTLGKQKIVFPKTALEAYSDGWGAPSNVFALYNDSNEFELIFMDCGDGARTYSLGFVMGRGRLLSCMVTPGEMSEVGRSVKIFDANGRVTYDGPCDYLGNPNGKSKK